MTGASLPRPIGRQREVLYLPAQGHVVVLGTAGSGKTTLASLRSLYLSDQSTAHGGRTLLVTFNRCLVTYMRHMGFAESQHPVDVRNYHHFARGYLASRGRLPWSSICSPDERSKFVSLALAEARDANVQSRILRRPESGPPAPDCSTERITRRRGWSSIRYSCHSCQMTIGLTGGTCGTSVNRRRRFAMRGFSTWGLRAPGRA